tara:strand:+ start:19295 stop:19891 length:597 start_codon:yes stop_codon:yes gene_type:complete
MKSLFYLLLTLLLTSCIAINVNDYEFLNYAEKEYLRPYKASTDHEIGDNSACFKLYEINTPEVKSITRENEFTWVHIWLPFCPNESCQNIAQYEWLEKRHQSKGLNLAFISATYDIDDIIKIVQHSKFTKPVYVLQNSYYGRKNKKIRTKFHSEIDPNYEEEDPIFHSDYLFIKDSLVYFVNNMNDSIIESHSMKSIN